MLNDVQIEIFRPKLTTYQREFLYNEERFTIVEASTKCGKTFSMLWWLFEAANENKKNGAQYWWVAPIYSQAQIAFNRLRRVVEEYNVFDINISHLTVTLPTGVVIAFKSAEKADNLYGDDVHAAVFDEATRAREDAWYALRSTLTKTRGKCKIIGNTKGKKNWVYKLGQRARGGEPDYAYFRVTAWDAVKAGILLQEEIEQAQRDLPEHVFRELYLAEPSEDGANPFGLDHIQRVLQDVVISTKTESYGIDLAKSFDWTVITGLDAHGRITYFSRFQKDWLQTKEEIIRVVGRTECLVDSTGVGDAIVEDLQKSCSNVEGFKYTSDSKQKLMEGLAFAIQNNKVQVLKGIMQEEVESFEFEYSQRGVKYSAPSGLHDDCVNSLALAYKKLNAPVVVSGAPQRQYPFQPRNTNW